MKKTVGIYILATILFVGTSASAATVKCPAERKKMTFKALSLYDGDPKNNADLAPDNATRRSLIDGH